MSSAVDHESYLSVRKDCTALRDRRGEDGRSSTYQLDGEFQQTEDFQDRICQRKAVHHHFHRKQMSPAWVKG